LFVSIVGDDGVRYYGSHLSAVDEGISPGVRVAAGQVLGRTGRSGNARNTPPHLHFGISRPTGPDDWEVRRGQLDPYPFLEAWRSGDRDRAPVLVAPSRAPVVCLYPDLGAIWWEGPLDDEAGTEKGAYGASGRIVEPTWHTQHSVQR
jgi:hypothetical protein